MTGTFCVDLLATIVIDAADVPYTRRVRAYWTNFDLPSSLDELFDGRSPLNGNGCMDAGRTLEPYTGEGKTIVRTIGKSWRDDPVSPEANTSLPVVVHDVDCERSQHLRAHEAERLMGLPVDCTAGAGASAKDRLRAIGDG